MNFDFENQDIERQQALIDMLRQQAMQSATMGQPQGQMVSGRFVAPHWTQSLGASMMPALQQININRLDSQNQQRKAVLAQAISKAKQDWLAQMPQGTPAQMSPAVQGNNPSAFVPPQEIAPAMPPSIGDRMKWLGQGASIPNNSVLTTTLGKMMESEISREDFQAARAASEKAMREERTERAKADREARIEAKRMEIIGAMERAREQGATMAMIKQIEMQGRKEIAAMTAGFAREKFEQGIEEHLQRSTEKLANAATAIAPLVVTGQAVQDMLDRYAGKSVPGVGYEALLTPPALKREANVNRATIQRFANAVARSEIGLSQTLSEQAQQALSNMSNGKFSEDEFKMAWPEILAKTNASITNLQGGYGPKVIERYNSQGGKLNLIKSSQKSPEERLEELRRKKSEGQ